MAFSVIRMGPETRVNTVTGDYQGAPSITLLSNGRWVTTWDGYGPDGRGVYQQVYGSDGTPETPAERRVNITPSVSAANGYDRNSSVEALADGGWVVTWMRNVSGSEEDVFVQRFDAAGNPLLKSNGAPADIRVNEAPVIGGQKNSKVTVLEDGGWVVTWVDIYLRGIFQQRYDADGQPQDGNKRITAPSTSVLLGSQDVATIRLADNTEAVVVVWAQRADNSAAPQLFFRIMDASGNPVIADRLIGPASTEHQVPRIKALPDGGFAVVWAAPGADGLSDVLLQTFDAQGDPQFQQPTRVNTIAAGKQYQPSVEPLENGRLLVTYTDEKSVGGVSYGDAHQRIFDADGQPSGPETPLSAWLGSSWNRESTIAYLGNGRWVAAWSNFNQDGDDRSGVSQRIFSLAEDAVLTAGDDVATGTDAPETLQVAANGLSAGDRIFGGGEDDVLEMLAAGTLDITKPLEFESIEIIQGTSGKDTIITNSARLKDVMTIHGGDGDDELRLFDGGTYDFTGKSLIEIERISLDDFATTVTVGNAATGLLIHGEGSEDKVILSGGSFTKAERYRLFKQGIETVQDDGGTYVKTLGEILKLNGDQSFAQAGSTVRLDDDMDAVVPTAPPSFSRLIVTIANFIPGHDRLIVSNVDGVIAGDGVISVDGVGVGWFMGDVTDENVLDIGLIPAATPERVQKLLHALSYMNIATGATVSGQRTVNILLEDVGGSATTATVYVNVLGQGDNVPPTVSFRSPGPVTGTDTGSVSPLANIKIRDGNSQDEVTVTVSFDREKGRLILGGENFGIYDPTNGTYKVTGDPDDVTDDLRALQFDPRDRSDPVGQIESTEFTIHVTDGRAENDARITVDVATANRAPGKPTLSHSTVAELAADGTVIGTVSGADPNRGDSVAYSLVGAEDAPVRLETRDGAMRLVVTNGVRLDHEQRKDYVFTLRATDARGLSNDTVVVLKVDDVNPERTLGSTDADVIKGGAGGDTLGGAAGNDTIFGGSGNDVLTGNAGKDIFAFDTKANKKANVDKIADFSAKDDSIWLDNAVFTKIGKGAEAKPGKLAKAMFWTGKAAHDSSDRIVYDKASGALYYDSDGTGRAAQVKIATLKKGLALTEKDFFVI